ncbi:MAG: serine/threonine-protein kinase [Bacillota bacterium]
MTQFVSLLFLEGVNFQPPYGVSLSPPMTKGIYTLAEIAKNRINYGSLSLEFLVGSKVSADPMEVPDALPNSYMVKKLIGRGATSYSFLAEQLSNGFHRTLKIFLPRMVTFKQIYTALQKHKHIKDEEVALPEIIEAGQVDLQFPDGSSSIVPCVVLKYINSGAKTFAEFLQDQENFGPEIFERFIMRVGNTLAAIEKAGLKHGDLHEGNILVVPGLQKGVASDFWVIDFVGVPSSCSPELQVSSDIDNFRDHLLRAAIIATERYPGYSIRLLLGERAFRVLEGLREGSYKTFGELLQDFYREKTQIPKGHFHIPISDPFEWIRVEQIDSPELLYKLFEPVPSRFWTISRFGNTWISGPRGCGKSHYLRVLAFQPSVLVKGETDSLLAAKLRHINYNFKKAFGVLFRCRLGEFKAFTPEAIGKAKFDPSTQASLRHIIVLKIWTKTLYTLREGLESYYSAGKPVLKMPTEIEKLRHFLSERLGTIAVVNDSDSMAVFLQCLAVCTARENSAIAVWNELTHRPHNIQLLNESDLDSFFGILRNIFPDLRQTRFYILVDDASYGHIHYEMQKVLNSFIRASQANHCFKITCDKFMYTLDTADGRAIDTRNEVSYQDLGEVSVKAQRRGSINLSQYMARVIDRRLEEAGYMSNIKTILGKSQDARQFLSALSIPGARLANKKDSHRRPPIEPAYFAGWNIIWSLSHGSVRTLLELVEHIFTTNNVTKNTMSVSLQDQDTAVREFSIRQFKALTFLPGEIEQKLLGPLVKNVISAIGAISKQYLERYDTGEKGRWYETISIERLDTGSLKKEAQDTLDELIRYGLLLGEGITFSRAQFGLCQRYDMNKIFSPAFKTTYRVRNHIYLSQERFEEFLLHPDLFIKRHRNKLQDLTHKSTVFRQGSLFTNGDDE